MTLLNVNRYTEKKIDRIEKFTKRKQENIKGFETTTVLNKSNDGAFFKVIEFLEKHIGTGKLLQSKYYNTDGNKLLENTPEGDFGVYPSRLAGFIDSISSTRSSKRETYFKH